MRRIALRRRPGGGYDVTGPVFATGFGEQDPLGTASGRAARSTSRCGGPARRARSSPDTTPESVRFLRVLKLAGLGGDKASPSTEPQAQRRPAPGGATPAPIQDALHAGERHDRGDGPPLNAEQVEALMDLTNWAFNGVAPDHPQYEGRLAAGAAQALERHGRRAA